MFREPSLDDSEAKDKSETLSVKIKFNLTLKITWRAIKKSVSSFYENSKPHAIDKITICLEDV